jgi:hypothetical protein
MMKSKPGTSHIRPKGISSTMMSYIIAAPQVSFSGASPLEEGKALLLDVHEGVCGHHTSLRTMVRKAFQDRFYWPTTASDVRSCRGC